jgi:tetratricopeptide (TPR) repeat protein
MFSIKKSQFRSSLTEGINFHKQREYGKALKSYDRARELFPSSSAAPYHMGLTYFELEKFREALGCYEAAIQLNGEEDPEIYNSKGLVLLSLGDPDQALVCFQKAIQLSKLAPHVGADRGSHRHVRADHDSPLRKSPPDHRRCWEWYRNKGVSLIHLGKYEDAMECFDHGCRGGDYHEQGNYFASTGKTSESLKWFDRAIALTPRSWSVYYDKGNALSQLQRDDEAIECYDEAIALNSDGAQIYLKRGFALLQLSRHEEAKRSFLIANELEPGCYDPSREEFKGTDDERHQVAHALCSLEDSLSLSHRSTAVNSQRSTPFRQGDDGQRTEGTTSTPARDPAALAINLRVSSLCYLCFIIPFLVWFR